jgi:YD repeat-containing protein
MKLTRTLITLIALIAALLATSAADAQQICYSYDLLGRLTGVIDQNNQAAFYDYDSVGNILAIRREGSAAPVNVFSIHPPGDVPGTRVDLFGYGFSTTANQNQVTWNKISLNVVSANHCHLLVEIPAGVGSGQFVVTTPAGKATSSQVFSSLGMSILAPATGLVAGASLQLSPVITGCSSLNVIWSVNSIVGGNASIGTISPLGSTRPQFSF